MQRYSFSEATGFLVFIEKHFDMLVGHVLAELFTDRWPLINHEIITDEPIILRIDDCYIVINYFIPSDIELIIGSKEEIAQYDGNGIINTKNVFTDYYNEEFSDGIPKNLIEGCLIQNIELERFSKSFECNIQGDVRPDGGDYFSTIRFFLDSGTILCLCGSSSKDDGYCRIWCESH